MGHARKERVLLFGTDQRITSGPAAKRPHSKAEYTTAPERFAESQIFFPCTAGAVHTGPSLHLPRCSNISGIEGIANQLALPAGAAPYFSELPQGKEDVDACAVKLAQPANTWLQARA
jgi:hypothetical protein